MPITRRRTIDDDDDDFDERGLLKDGRRLRVPLTMMDSANQQALAERYPLRSARSAPGGRRQCSEQDIVDAAQPPIGRSIPSLAALLDATSPEHDVLMQRRAEADEAYRDSIRELSNAW